MLRAQRSGLVSKHPRHKSDDTCDMQPQSTKAKHPVLCPDSEWSEVFWEHEEDQLNIKEVVVLLCLTGV